MLHLGITTSGPTFERMRSPLAERGIDVSYLDVTSQAIPITDSQIAFDLPNVDIGYVYPSRVMEGDVTDTFLDIKWVNDRCAVLTSRNKAGVLAKASHNGIPIPPSVLVSNPVEEEDLIDVWEQFDGPVVIKPNSTTRGVGVARADDLDSFLGISDYLELAHDYRATGDKSYLVQAFVPEARDVRVMLIDGSYVGAVERRAPRAGGWKHNVHRGADAVGIEPADEVVSLAETVAEMLSIPILGVDILVTEYGPLLSETNARPTIDAAEKYAPGFWDTLADAIRRRV